MKLWRKNRTTIVITHDLSPIDPHDFVYVMTEGRVVEQGFRVDLEANYGGPFHSLAHTQQSVRVDLSIAEDDLTENPGWEIVAEGNVYPSEHSTPRIEISDVDDFRFSRGGFLVPPTVDLARASRELRTARRASATFVGRQETRATTPTTPPRPPSAPRRISTRFDNVLLPPLYDYSHYSSSDRRDSSMSFAALELAGKSATVRRPGGARIKHRTMVDDDLKQKWSEMQKGGGEGEAIAIDVQPIGPPRATMSLGQMARRYYPTIPSKFLFYTGLLFSMVVGVCTPVFAFLLSKLLANLGNPNAAAVVTTTSLLVLLVAVIDGSATFLKFYVLERCAMGWVVSLRQQGLALVIKQDKAWFDRPENSTSSLCHSLVKDSEDARLMIGTVIGQLVVVTSMLALGLAWAFSAGWELTLVGLGLAPVFVITTRLQAGVLQQHESQNKVLREEVSKKFHQVRCSISRSSLSWRFTADWPLSSFPQTVSNLRAIRSMSIEPVFAQKFEHSIAEAYVGGVRAAPFAGMGAATGFALTYLAEGTFRLFIETTSQDES